MLATARINIDLVNAKPARALPDESADPKDDDNGKGKVLHEESLDRVEAAAGRADGHVELLLHLLAPVTR